ncbi:hypothetical protein ACSTI1_00175, partial [Vibrio parahaemolyticus]
PAGMDPKGRISPSDVQTVRGCGESLVETFRQQAIKVRKPICSPHQLENPLLQGSGNWMQQPEQEQWRNAESRRCLTPRAP